MSSYHSSFSYLGKDSQKDFKLQITHFDVDDGETDSYLSQDQIYTDSYNGIRRILYGTKWNAVPIIKITVIKQNHNDFSVAECRDIYRWLTGNPQATWLDLYADNKLQYSFSCTVQDVKPQKMDARTIGFNIYFESISPWAYSAPYTVSSNLGQTPLKIDEEGLLYNLNDEDFFSFDKTDGALFTEKGILTVNNNVLSLYNLTTMLPIESNADDLYSYVYMDVTITNTNSSVISIKNTIKEKKEATIIAEEETKITEMGVNEVITLSSGQFILSDKENKIFGDNFNFVWPRLTPDKTNEFTISGNGICSVKFTWREPIKIGDLAINTGVTGDGYDCNE